MIEILILYELSKKVLTIYGISKEIKSEFSVLLTPSYGTIKPALKRLESQGCVRTQKNMSKGGRPSVYYSLTKDGERKLVELLIEKPLENPVQFLTTARVKLVAATVLHGDAKKELYKVLKTKSEILMIEIRRILESNNLDYCSTMVYDNLVCEYKNFISLLEGLERASKD
jgi:DNA-binding PadR family transcriptional regulator